MSQKDNVVPRGVIPQVPIHQAITAKNFIAAAEGNRRQQRRIRNWNNINKKIFRSGGTLLPPKPKA